MRCLSGQRFTHIWNRRRKKQIENHFDHLEKVICLVGDLRCGTLELNQHHGIGTRHNIEVKQQMLVPVWYVEKSNMYYWLHHYIARLPVQWLTPALFLFAHRSSLCCQWDRGFSGGHPGTRLNGKTNRIVTNSKQIRTYKNKPRFDHSNTCGSLSTTHICNT